MTHEASTEAAASVSGRRAAPAAYALLAVGLAFLWQLLTVTHNYGGNWTSLFYTGENWPPPPQLSAERIHVFPDTAGYDGQFYHYVAHDPLLTSGFSSYVDDPAVRWRRILVPGLAYLAAFGQDAFIDDAYLFVILGFLYLGAYWLGRYCLAQQWNPAWGLSFLVVPATMTSIEVMTVDVALAALAAGYACYAAGEKSRRLYLILLLAPLARETGVLLVFAGCLHALARRQWIRAARIFSCCLPFFAWCWHVAERTPPSNMQWIGLYPFAGLVSGTVRVLEYPLSDFSSAFAVFVHALAIFGIWLALGFSAYVVWRNGFAWQPVVAGIVLFALLAVFLGHPEPWSDAYAYGRFLSPWLLWLALVGISWRKPWLALPLGMLAPRVAAQLATHLPGILSGLFPV